jgi:thiamine-monophosphate kinase
MGEFDIIARYFAPLSKREPGALDLKDDAALLDVAPGNQIVITSDCLVAGVHFFPSDPPQSIARKALGVNLSDLAAMGATSRAYTLAVAWPRSTEEDWISAFADGLQSAQSDWHVTLIGGDTVATDGPLTLTITAFGDVGSGSALTRGGAQPGDFVFVSGAIGDASLGLLLINGGIDTASVPDAAFLIDRYYHPQPRVTLGPRLIGIATSATDISDGLGADMGHIVDVSGVSVLLDSTRIPLSAPARALIDKNPDLLNTVLGGGDDYEILFTAPQAMGEKIEKLAHELSIPLTKIGEISRRKDGVGVEIVDQQGRVTELIGGSGYQHF